MRTKILSILIAVFLLAGMLTLSLTVSAESKSDTTPPTLSVKLNGDKLTVSAKDSDSGLQAVFIDSTRVNSLVNGKATVNLKDYAGKDKKISVYAMDYVGNKSEVKKIDNPYYAEPTTAKATEALQQTTTAPKSTSQSGGGNQSNSSQSSRSSQSASGSAATAPAINSTSRILPSPTTSSVSSISAGALTPNGQGTVLDSASGEEDDKQFYTITTDAGNVFYLIVDGKRGTDNVYFLNGVTESDLMALAEKDENISISAVPTEPVCICTDKCADGKPNADCPVCKEDISKCQGKTQPTEATEPSEPQAKEKEGGSNIGMIIFIVLAVAAVGGVGYYLKIVRPKQQRGFDDSEDEAESSDYGEAYGADEYGSPEYLPEDDEYEYTNDGDGE